MAKVELQGVAKSYDGKTPVIHGIDLVLLSPDALRSF